MKHIARALAAQGRNQDTELVHMTKGEVAALHQLAAHTGIGSLTKNPKTGLTEASLLGTVLTVAGTAIGGYFGGPWGAAAGGALGGAGGAAVDHKDVATGALIGGATGYVGGTLAAEAAPAAELGTAAPAAVEVTATPAAEGALSSAAGAAGETTGAGIGSLGGNTAQLATQGTASTGATAAEQAVQQQAAEQAAQQTAQQAAQQTTEQTAQQAAQQQATEQASQQGVQQGVQDTGIRSVSSGTEQGLSPAGSDAYVTPESSQGMINTQNAGTDFGSTSANQSGHGLGSKALGWAVDNPKFSIPLATMAYQGLTESPQGNKQPVKHSVEMKGRSRSNRTYTGATGSGPGEKTYFADNNPYSYTSAPSTYEMRYAEGGMVNTGDLFNAPLMPAHQRQGVTQQGYAEGGAVPAAELAQNTTQAPAAAAPQQGYQHTQFTSPYQAGLNTQIAPGTMSPAMAAGIAATGAPAPTVPTAGQSTGIAGLAGAPTAGTQTAGAGVDYSSPDWYGNIASGYKNPAEAAAAKKAAADAAAAAAASDAERNRLMGVYGSHWVPTTSFEQDKWGTTNIVHGGSMQPYTLEERQQMDNAQRLAAFGDQSGATGGKITKTGIDRIGYAKGGILNLRTPNKHLDPRFLKGPGDGMSDNIPAYIDGGAVRQHEPIRVANNEFIVPADVVSHLGNGSSDAGAKKLEIMATNVRKARTGKTKQAPKINANKYLPT